MTTDWAAIAARQNRETDRRRAMATRQASGERFRGKGGRTLAAAFAAGNVGRVESRAKARKRRRSLRLLDRPPGRQPVPVTRQMEGVVTLPRPDVLPGIPIQKAIITGPRGLAIRAGAELVRSIPGISKILGRTVQAPGPIGRALQVGAGAAAGALAGEALEFLYAQRRGQGPMLGPTAPSGGRPVTMQPRAPLGQLAQGQEFPGGPFVVKSWDTYPGPGVTGGGQWPIFSLLSDGRIVVQKSNGQWKVYRPKKNLVISSNPRLRDIRKLDRMHRRVVKMMKRMVPAPRRRK